MLGCTKDLFTDPAKAAFEFGLRLTLVDEYGQKVLENPPAS